MLYKAFQNLITRWLGLEAENKNKRNIDPSAYKLLRIDGQLVNVARLCVRRPLNPTKTNHFDEHRFFIDLYELKIEDIPDIYLLAQAMKPLEEDFVYTPSNHIQLSLVRSYEEIAQALNIIPTKEVVIFLRELRSSDEI